MKQVICAGLFISLIVGFPLNVLSADHRLDLELEANAIVKKFAGALKPKLKSAIKNGGFEKAIEVCATEAPAIAKQLSQDTGWQVKRVSLKPRSPHAAPDAFERKVLKTFDVRQRLGQAVDEMTYSALHDGSFHFMKAQAVEALCLNCHGKTIAPNIQKALHEHYPNDLATGYSIGEIRGAFSLVKKMDKP